MTDAHPLTLYNSLTRKKETFIPADPKRVTMYNCGPTVYSYAHIGNARAAVVADVLFRVLRHIYGEDHVVYARNITDVDDKIIASAKEQGVDISVITEKYARIYNEDLAAIGCLMPTEQPKCTAHIDGMVEMISDLMAKGFAYESDGHVFFDVSKYDDYGKLSGNTMDQLKSAGRTGEGEVARKRNSADFVLWKPELDGVGWDAPFGKGRPGWHIECSAMAKSTLGETIDIHCGGVDLKFPHHENEIAQSECAHNGAPMANYWVHNEFLNMGSEKMSKSLGNVTLISDLLKEWDGEILRLALLKGKYTEELAWDIGLVSESEQNALYLFRTLRLANLYPALQMGPSQNLLRLILDDLNTSGAIMELIHLAGEINHRAYRMEVTLKSFEGFAQKEEMALLHQDEFIREYFLLPNELRSDYLDEEKEVVSKMLGVLKSSANLLGLLQKDPDEWFRGGLDYDALVAEYDSVRAQALAAKADGDKAKMGEMFVRSDELRDQFKSEGIIVETADGKSTWRKA